MMELQQNVLLSPYTTIGLGGPARFFCEARTEEDIRQALVWARAEGLPAHVLGGGSNTIFADAGFAGLVLHIALRGVAFREEGPWVYATLAAGEPWDEFVQACVERGLAGVECLSGIPGSAGATPIQNVGAYGQEVSETIVTLSALDRDSLEVVEFAAAECCFGYRCSRFKGVDRCRYVITAVTFRLDAGGRPEVCYPELQAEVDLAGLGSGRPALQAVRAAVLALRQKKSMVVDAADPHSRSVGSFFLNPVLSPEQLAHLEERWRQLGGTGPLPLFPGAEGIKVAAAWLVEQAGFSRGYRRGGVGISDHHCLALVNYGGTTRELLALAAEIRERVYARLGVRLEVEPEVVSMAIA